MAQLGVFFFFLFLTANVSDYEASLKKEGGIPDGPVLESLLSGETLDKKVETKEEESMSECQVRLCPAPSCALRPRLLVACPGNLCLSACVALCVGDSLSVALCRSVLVVAPLPCECVCLCACDFLGLCCS